MLRPPTNKRLMPLAQLTQENPRRPVDWRWRRATQMQGVGRKASGRFGDALVTRVIKYLIAKKGGADSEHLASRWPDVYEIDTIGSASSVERWMLEGLILANEPIEAIADQYGLSTHAVGLYEKCFFDVRTRLTKTFFIFGQVLDTAVNGEFDDTNKDKWWKVLGYHGYRCKLGSAILKSEWDYDILPEAVKNWFDGVITSKLTKRGAMAVSSRRMNSEVASFILDNYWNANRAETERIAASGARPGITSDSKTQGMLEALTLTVASVTDVKTDHVEQRANDRLAKELEQVGIETNPTLLPASEKPDESNG